MTLKEKGRCIFGGKERELLAGICQLTINKGEDTDFVKEGDQALSSVLLFSYGTAS